MSSACFLLSFFLFVYLLGFFFFVGRDFPGVGILITVQWPGSGFGVTTGHQAFLMLPTKSPLIRWVDLDLRSTIYLPITTLRYTIDCVLYNVLCTVYTVHNTRNQMPNGYSSAHDSAAVRYPRLHHFDAVLGFFITLFSFSSFYFFFIF